ncbi:DUF2911 domain-containing protein [Polaribacter aquimarinus]|uniref:Dihydrolipoamide dehydrogenase n=1 Tax=Polaribacter aquimarinus TaxID=2100726 RepID=A0A2U2JA17_9FLAO|nr:DUF2911 domain-containing protein [Polaribacter aquimarinus]PWG05188.1 dihydrolipoamide dehydrogenase [Polaribacter aquimarinus]
MKKIILSLFVAAVSFSTNAQIKTPAPSPFQKIEQKVGLTDVTLEYSRPGVKGRTIFGDLVPFDKIWRTGANARTKITFSSDVSIDGHKLKKGTYAIFTKPAKKSWDVYFYTDYKGGGAPQKWDETKVAAQIKVTVESMPMKIETFTMTFDDVTNNSAILGILWENTYVGLKFETPTDTMVSESIKKIMSGPSANDMYGAASYYYATGKDIKKAKEWIDKAVAMTSGKPRFWYLRQQSLIHAKAGNKKSAITAAKQSLALAEKAGNIGFVKMNKASLKEWGAL